MHPILLQSGGLVLGTHDAFLVIAVVVALVPTWRIASRHRRWDQDLVIIVAGGLLAGAIFARYGLVFRYLKEAPTPGLDGFLQYGGRTLLGGLAGAYLGVIVTKRLIGYRRRTGDLLAPGVALGMAIGRIGCFLTERPGTPTTLPWGVSVPADAAARYRDCGACATGAAMHPSFAYEAIFLGVIAWWLFRLERRHRHPPGWRMEGDTFKLFLAAYATFRFAVEFVRGNPVMALGLSGSQLMVLPAILLLTVHFIRSHRTAPAAAMAPSTP